MNITKIINEEIEKMTNNDIYVGGSMDLNHNYMFGFNIGITTSDNIELFSGVIFEHNGNPYMVIYLDEFDKYIAIEPIQDNAKRISYRDYNWMDRVKNYINVVAYFFGTDEISKKYNKLFKNTIETIDNNEELRKL